MPRPPSEQIVTYVPDNTLRHGYASIAGDIARELVDNRWLTYQLLKRDVLAFYKQSLLGVFWMLLVPLITIGSFIALRGSGVVSAGETAAPYPIFAGLGVAVWQLFAQGLVSGSNALVQGGEMITRINFSKKSLIIASLGRTLVSFGVMSVLVVVLFVVYRFQGYAHLPGPEIIVLPLVLLPTVLLTLGLSFFLSLINGIVRDIAAVLGVVVTFLMLLTPVLYERPRMPEGVGEAGSWLVSATQYNPLFYLVSAPRDIVLEGRVEHLQGFLLSSAGALVFFGVALVSFHLTETRIAERI